MPIKGVTRLQNPQHCVKCGLTFLGQKKHYLKDHSDKKHGPYCTECFAELNDVDEQPLPRDFTMPFDDDDMHARGFPLD